MQILLVEGVTTLLGNPPDLLPGHTLRHKWKVTAQLHVMASPPPSLHIEQPFDPGASPPKAAASGV